jgi:hypothetical protein
LNHTADTGIWKDRKWEAVPFELNAGLEEAALEIPATARVYYINLFTDDGLVVSSEHEEL